MRPVQSGSGSDGRREQPVETLANTSAKRRKHRANAKKKKKIIRNRTRKETETMSAMENLSLFNRKWKAATEWRTEAVEQERCDLYQG